MPGDLDEILVGIDCPKCNATFNRQFGQLRHNPVTVCECGAQITVDLSQTHLLDVDRLINEVNLPKAVNDNS